MFFSILVCFISGIVTVFGGLIIFVRKINRYRLISSSLYFAAGIMISVSVLDLSPSGFSLLIRLFDRIGILLFTIFGSCLLYLVILRYFISKSIKKITDNNNNHDSLYNVGFFSLIVIMLHNIPEGMATYLSTRNDFKLGLSLAIAIGLHNIPEGISIAVPLYYSSRSKLKALLYTFLAGMSELLGAIICSGFLTSFNVNYLLGFLYPIISGIMIFLSIEELIPTAKEYSNNTKPFFFIGFIIMIIYNLIM